MRILLIVQGVDVIFFYPIPKTPIKNKKKKKTASDNSGSKKKTIYQTTNLGQFDVRRHKNYWAG